MPTIPRTDLTVHPLCLGGNVFGGRADRDESFAVLDAYVAAGGDFVDTADLYADGESERVVGAWMADRGNRDDIVLATKLGMSDEAPGLSAANIRTAVDASLERLGTEHIDLYYAHQDDESVPMQETLEALDGLVREGKVRHVAASNFGAARLTEALELSEREGLASYVALQPHYNLMVRGEFEGELQDACRRHGLAVFPYFALAAGFLTGKYRSGAEPDTRRGNRYEDDPRGPAVLEALDDVAQAHGAPVAAVALAWLAAQDTVTSPIASARTPEQLDALLAFVDLELSAEQLELLDTASSR
ncbi:MAG TPA: aldo/keto reductase [Thermoleophilaceae bacterium]|nr:aldo/keto reductase [Thermoleophilaceae bacterium]